jgi:hypothetical protein
MRTLILTAVVAAFAAGCDGGKVASVSGTVTLDGKPLPNVHVNFQPIAEGMNAAGPGSHGKTDADGHYTLEVVGENRNGAYVGKHRVEITAATAEVDPTSDKPPPRQAGTPIPDEYNRNSTLTCTVPPGGKSDANFELLSKKPKK